MTEAELIEQYAKLHSIKAGYGRTGENGIEYFQQIIDNLEFPITSVLDYGCGKSNLVNMLDYHCSIKTYKYDPAVSGISDLNIDKVDLLLCTDVLEHIPVAQLDRFLERLQTLSDKMIFTVSVRSSGNTLPNGMPCHLIVMPVEWWLEKLEYYFEDVYNLHYWAGPKKFLGTTFKVDVNYE